MKSNIIMVNIYSRIKYCVGFQTELSSPLRFFNIYKLVYIKKRIHFTISEHQSLISLFRKSKKNQPNLDRRKNLPNQHHNLELTFFYIISINDDWNEKWIPFIFLCLEEKHLNPKWMYIWWWRWARTLGSIIIFSF